MADFLKYYRSYGLYYWACAFFTNNLTINNLNLGPYVDRIHGLVQFVDLGDAFRFILKDLRNKEA